MHPQAGSAKERILEVAADLFHLQGVSGTSVEEILKLSGTGKSQFYYHFESKHHVVREVLAFQLSRIFEAQGAFMDQLSSWQGIRAWFKALIKQHEQRELRGGCPIGSLAVEMADRDEDLRTLIVQAFEQWEAPLATGLQTMKDKGLLHAQADPAKLAETTMTSIQGGYLLATTKKDMRPMRNALDAAFLHLRSYAPSNSVGDSPP